MQKSNESFYTDDFDQEMIDFLLHNGYAVTGACKDMKPDLDNNYLNFSMGVGHFWTDNLSNIFSEQLTKTQFKEKIGMTDKKSDKQERIFKLIDKEGYSARSDTNKEFLEDYGIVVDGFYYYKGRVDAEGDLMEVNDDWCLIDNLSEEFQYFEEVDSIPLPKDKPKIEEVFVNQTNTFTKSMLKSGENVVKLNDGSYLLVLGNKLVDYSGWYNLNAFDEDLFHKQHSVEVENIYTTTEYFALEDLSEGKELTLIWQRESPEQKEKR